MSTQAPVIEIKDLHRSYGKVDAVKGLNLTVQPGRCYGFLGRNGAGKTSTIHCLLNLLRPEPAQFTAYSIFSAPKEEA